jgi:hypothetical protein
MFRKLSEEAAVHPSHFKTQSKPRISQMTTDDQSNKSSVFVSKVNGFEKKFLPESFPYPCIQ